MAVLPVTSRPEKILVVEDDEFSQQVIQLYLKKAGFENVHSALDGRQALDMIRAEIFDLILLDLNLPRLSGTEILHRLNADGTVRRTPIIAITSLSNVEETKAALDLGAEDYLPKPFNTRLLQDRITACLEKHRLSLQLAAETQRAGIERDQALAMQREWIRTDRLGLAADLFPGVLPGGGLVQIARLTDNRTGIAVGHVGGKGTGAALQAAVLREILRRELQKEGTVDAPEVIERLRTANIVGDVGIGIIDASARLTSWAALGSVALFGRNGDGTFHLARDAAHEELTTWLAMAQDPSDPIVNERRIPSALGIKEGQDSAALLSCFRETLTAHHGDELASVSIAALALVRP